MSLLFNEHNHTYGGNRTSATAFLSQFKKDFPKEIIAQKIADRDDKDPQDIIDEWDLNAKLSRTLGNTIDIAVEYWIRAGKRPKHPFLKSVVDDYVALTEDIKDQYTQIVVHNDTIAGTVDLIWKTDGAEIWDIKTYGDLDKENGYFLPPIDHIKDTPLNNARLQLSLYKHLAEHMGLEVTKIGILHWDGAFNKIELEPIDVKPLLQWQKNS